MRRMLSILVWALLSGCIKPSSAPLRSSGEVGEDAMALVNAHKLTADAVADFHDRPVIIAHRGASARAPENTLSAFRKAIQIGAEVAELDVHLSADGGVIVIHDETLDRTTDGEGRVADLDTAAIQAVDAGRWKDVKYLGERVPTLPEVLEAVGQELILCIELKGGEGLPEAVVSTVRDASAERRVLFFSFDPAHVRALKALEPEIPVVWLVGRESAEEEGYAVTLPEQAAEMGADVLGLSMRIVDAAIVIASHGAGLPVFAFTANRPDHINALIAVGVDGVITDRPDFAQDIVGQVEGD